MSILIFFGFSLFIVMVSTVYVIVSIKNLIRLKREEKSKMISKVSDSNGVLL